MLTVRCSYQKALNAGIFTRKFCTDNKNKKLNADYIGPPDPVSNLRPISFHQSENETKLEKMYREAREDTQTWNHNFWSKHNTNFIEERNKFRDNLMTQGKENLTADEMSIFYKKFLDKNWKTHAMYNITWYKKNVNLLLLEFRVRLSRLKFK